MKEIMNKPTFSIETLTSASWTVASVVCTSSEVLPDKARGVSADRKTEVSAKGVAELFAVIGQFTAEITLRWRAGRDKTGSLPEANGWEWEISKNPRGPELIMTNFSYPGSDSAREEGVNSEIKDFILSRQHRLFFDLHDYIEFALPVKWMEAVDSSRMVDYEIELDEAPLLKFSGRVFGVASNDSPKNDRTRWTRLKIFRTRGGKYIAVTEGLTRVKGEVTRTTASVCDYPHEIVKHLGFSALAKAVYQDAGIDYSETVE